MIHSRKNTRILVVDDDRSTCELVASSLELESWSVDRAHSSMEAENMFANGNYALVISDIYIDQSTGLDLLRNIQRLSPGTRLILMTAHATLETAVAAVQEGAFEYLSKPFDLEELFRVVQRALEPAVETGRSECDPGESASLSSIMVGKSAAMAQVYKQLARVAPTDSTVWISGESGTGKELVAQAIYQHSRRRDRPFIIVNCGALAETLLESELFGHVKGAFTGAALDRSGLFESASGGTLFLDEVTETAPFFQVKLLRLLQEGEYRPVGGNTLRRADVRILAASNRNVEECIAKGTFREDLYYRLAGFTIHLPPLRDRAEDIPLLVRRFLQQLSQNLKRHLDITEEAAKNLCACAWPGNVRQLRNMLEKLAILVPDGTIRGEDIECQIAGIQSQDPIGERPPDAPSSLSQLEKDRIREVLLQCRGNKSRAALILGIDRSTLYRKLEAYGMIMPSSIADLPTDEEGNS